jgi:hypothetical protein
MKVCVGTEAALDGVEKKYFAPSVDRAKAVQPEGRLNYFCPVFRIN